MRGYVDHISPKMISGWAIGNGTAPVEAEIYVDGKRLGTASCSQFRQDLKDTGISDGNSAFQFAISPPLDVSSDHVVTVRCGDFDFLGKTGIGKIDIDQLARSIKINYDTSSVSLQKIAFLEDEIAIRGTVLSNKVPSFDLPNVSIEKKAPNALLNRFGLAEWDISAKVSDQKTDIIEVPLLHQFTSLVIPTRQYDSEYVPPEQSIRRVNGQIGAQEFITRGLTDARRFTKYAEKFGSFGEGGRWLDWGSGPGRVAVPLKRYFVPSWEVYGADVDTYNIDVGKRLSPEISYHAIDFDPPLPFPDRHFDVIHGLSVMTHLRQEDQSVWLAELRRVVKPGGIVILTTHGEITLLQKSELLFAPVMSSLFANGFSDSLPDRNLGPLLQRQDYYRATLQTAEYTARLFSEFFEICLHVGGPQDEWVLKRP